jgi:hypothetical protein
MESNDPIYDRMALLSEDAEFEVFHDALWAVLRLPTRIEDLYDHWGYDKNCGYNEALADVREAISRALRVEQ